MGAKTESALQYSTSMAATHSWCSSLTARRRKTQPYYASKARGVANVCGKPRRYVMTTRSDNEIVFRWEDKRRYLY